MIQIKYTIKLEKFIFGNGEELSKFAGDGQIIIPKTVILEREYQLRSLFTKQVESLKNNSKLLYNWLQKPIDEFDIDKKINELRESNQIFFKVIDISDGNILFEIRKFGINRIPPFEEIRGSSDKGFKDCCILFTVLEFIKNVEKGSNIFFITGDNKLKEGILNNCDIKVVENYSEYRSFISEKLLELIKKHYADDNLEINDLRTNNKGELVVSILKTGLGEKRLIVKLNEGEIYEMVGELDVENVFNNFSLNDILKKLYNSLNFSYTHVWIAILKNYFAYLSRGEAAMLLESFEKNSQIKMIIEDEDVSNFAWELYRLAKPSLSQEDKDRIRELLPLPF